ncbi:MAG TPA: type IV pili twitching motility protein PilT [Lachnospiraceae bacterium]|nr:type IV pili twitching motility protein PilT [Lachnospiraceae bacterium]
MDIVNILSEAVNMGASDIFIIAGIPVSYKVNGSIQRLEMERLMPESTREIIDNMYKLADDRSLSLLLDSGDDNFSFSVKNLSRFRVNTYKQRGSLAAIVRVVSFKLPVYTELNIPENVMKIADFNKGFVLVTGPAASGKSTSLACIVDAVNENRNWHIITLEDPIEYLHKHKKSVVSQREVPMDTPSYVVALMAALRQSPDMILIGEMRESDTIRTAVTAAETGHFVISTLHTIGAANTIDRIIDAFPEQQQQQIRVQLSMVLRAVVSQQLIPTVDGKVVPAFEVMFINSAIRNMIRESKIHQIDSAIFSSGDENMISMDTSIYNLYKSGRITGENALLYSINKELMQKKININV